MAISLKLNTRRQITIATATRLPPPYQVRGRNDMRKTERPWRERHTLLTSHMAGAIIAGTPVANQETKTCVITNW